MKEDRPLALARVLLLCVCVCACRQIRRRGRLSAVVVVVVVSVVLTNLSAAVRPGQHATMQWTCTAAVQVSSA